MTVRVYKSTDGSAPVLTGAVNDLVNLLDKCLVAGYGSATAAGWTKAYTGTNKAAFRQGADSSQFYLRVQDDAPGGGGAKEARVVGYETMSDVDTGTAPFPTAAQSTNGLFARKSNTADATARPWMLVADASVFYLFIQTGDSTTYCSVLMFGDIYSYKTPDPYKCAIMSRTTENQSTGSYESFGPLTTTASGTTSGCYIARSYTGVGGSIAIGKHSDNIKGAGQTTMGTGGYTYPCAVDNGIILAPAWINESSLPRGHLRGIWVPMHSNPLTGTLGSNDTVNGIGGLSGKTLTAVSLLSSVNGQVLVETSDTWD